MIAVFFLKLKQQSCINMFKLLLLLDKDENGCNDIGVVIATKGSHYLLCSQQYFSVGTVLPKSITGAFSSNSRLDVREVKTGYVTALSRYFGIKFLSLEIR